VCLLQINEHAGLQIAFIAEPRAHAAAERGPAGVVQLADLGVVARLREVAAAEERLKAIGRRVFELERDVLVFDVGVVVDRAALPLRDNRKAVGIEETAFDRHRELVPRVASEEVELRRSFVAVLRRELERPARGTAGDDVDHAAHGDVAVQARRGAFGDLDAIDAGQRDAAPVDPAAERIVEGNAVEQDERAALTARPDAAERHALRGRLRDEAAGAAEEAERRHLAQDVVGDERRRLLDRFAGDNAGARRHIAKPLFASRRRDGDRFQQRGRLQDDFDLTSAIVAVDTL
jgi:hypothetical protein